MRRLRDRIFGAALSTQLEAGRLPGVVIIVRRSVADRNAAVNSLGPTAASLVRGIGANPALGLIQCAQGALMGSPGIYLLDRTRRNRSKFANERSSPSFGSSITMICPRSPTDKSHPDSYCGEFDEGEVVGVVFFEAGGLGSEVFELVEDAFDEISKAVEIWTERGDVDAPWHRFDVGPGPSFVEGLAQGVAVVGAIGEQNLARGEAIEHIGGAAPVVRLACGQLEGDGQAIGVDEGVDLGGQSAARAPHASGVRDVPSGGVLKTPFLTLAAC